MHQKYVATAKRLEEMEARDKVASATIEDLQCKLQTLTEKMKDLSKFMLDTETLLKSFTGAFCSEERQGNEAAGAYLILCSIEKSQPSSSFLPETEFFFLLEFL